jgi:hypothetical protein
MLSGAGRAERFFRDEPFDTLAKCIPAVRHGQIWAEGESMRHVVEALSKAMPVHFRDGGGMGRLSKRKTDVARLVARKIALPPLIRCLQRSVIGADGVPEEAIVLSDFPCQVSARSRWT